MSGTAGPAGRNQGYGPRPLGAGGGAGRAEGRRPPLAHRSRVRGTASTPRERPRSGRGRAHRGQAQGKDERGGAALRRVASANLRKHPTSDNTYRPPTVDKAGLGPSERGSTELRVDGVLRS